jgi:hypothetical protein
MLSVEAVPTRRRGGSEKRPNPSPQAIYMRDYRARKSAGEIMRLGPRLIENPSKNTLRMRAYRAKKRAEAEANQKLQTRKKRNRKEKV